jgi:hypothetical protein
MNEFETKDFYLSGFLLCKGFPLLENEREDGFTTFTFNDSPKLKKIVKEYYRSESTVDPAIYGQILRQLKGVMHNSVSTQNPTNLNEKQCTKQV